MSELAILGGPKYPTKAYPECISQYFKFKEMNLPEATRSCEHKAVWLDEDIFRAGTKGVDAVAAIRKIQTNAKELSAAAEKFRK
jgi:hypothetical protein